jgi:hypothetical protein
MGVLPGVLRGGLRRGQHRRGAVHATKTIAACAVWLGVSGTFASEIPAPAALREAVPAAQLVGRGKLTWFGFEAYDAQLWAPPGFRAADLAQQPFALELRYARSFKGRDIAARSIEEMRRAGRFNSEQAQRWERRLTELLPDVKPGDRITGVHRPGQGAAFVVNGKPAGEIADPAFAELFFAIWLGPNTSQPSLRAALLGEKR